MTTDVDARLRADSQHWRGAQSGRPPLALATALATIPELDEDDAAAVFELTGGPPPPHRTTHRRWVWAAAAAAVVLLAGAGAGVFGITRHETSPTTGIAGLRGTSWVAPGASTNGYASTLTFDEAGTKLTTHDSCNTFPFHVTVGRNTLRIGGPDGQGTACSPPFRIPVAGDPSVAAQKALDAVLQGTVTWTIENRTLILRRGANTAMLYPTATIAQRCAATEATVTVAGATHRYPFGPQSHMLTVRVPADIDAAASGPCRAAVTITFSRATILDEIQPHRYGQWRVTQPDSYQLSLTLNVCTPGHNDCSLGLKPLRINVSVTP